MDHTIENMIIDNRMEIEVVGGEIVMHFDVRGAEEPDSAERELEAFEGAAVSMQKAVAEGKVRLRIRGADATPRIAW